MAKDINNPLVGELLQRAFDLKGRVRPSLEEFIVPTISLGDLSLSLGPSIKRHAACRVAQAAVSGQRFVFRFEAIPGTICVITRVFFHSAAGATEFAGAFVGNAATVSGLGSTALKGYTDGRLLPGTPFGAPVQPSGVVTFGTQVGPGGILALFSIQVPAAGLVYEPPPGTWVVGTGGSSLFGFLEGFLALNNTLVTGGFEWDEYPVL